MVDSYAATSWLSVIVISDHLIRVQQLYKELIEKLSVRSVAAELYQKEVLSFEDLQAILHIDNECEAARKFLGILVREDSNESDFKCFLEALKNSNQHHIFLWISYEGKLF